VSSGVKIHVVSRLLIGIIVEPGRELALIMQGISSSRERRGRDKDACHFIVGEMIGWFGGKRVSNSAIGRGRDKPGATLCVRRSSEPCLQYSSIVQVQGRAGIRARG
jgi:hypothetical protein